MTQLYPPIASWIVPNDAMSATLSAVVEEGQGVRESGALWLGRRSEISRVTAVVFPRGKGVNATAGRWKVSPEVFGAVTRWAKPLGLCLLGVVHTHLPGIPARLSRADREYSVQVPGILAVVIGEGGSDRDHLSWGWYVYEGTDYRRLQEQELAQRLEMNPKLEEDLCFRVANADGISELGEP
jgi:hypothetical protein